MEQHPTVNLMVDFQYSADMPLAEMEASLKRTAAHVDEMRKAGIPTVWITLGEQAALDTGTAGAKGQRDLASLERAGFFGHGPNVDEAHLARFKELVVKYGPRPDEAIYTKPYFGAFTEQKDLPRLAAHVAQQRSDLTDAHKALEGPTLAKYLHDMGTREVTLMGGNSNVCVTETAMGAAINGMKATVLADRVVSADDLNFGRPAFQEEKVRTKLNNITDNPAALATDQTHKAFADPNLLTAAEKAAIRTNVEVKTSANYLHPVVRAQAAVKDVPEAHAPQQKTFVLLLAPSGAGKTTRINTHNDPDAVHINRDAITSDLLTQHGIDPRLAGPNERTQINRILQEEAEPAFYKRLQEEMAKPGTHKVIVDYPPGGDGKWIEGSIATAKKAGFRVEVEGITINPAESLGRVLGRNASGLEADKIPAVIESNQSRTKSWLDTYQKFPEQLGRASALADETRLYDNNAVGAQPKLIATGKGGQPLQVTDRAAYAGFIDLQKLSPATASFTAQVASVSTNPAGKPEYKFEAKLANHETPAVVAAPAKPAGSKFTSPEEPVTTTAGKGKHAGTATGVAGVALDIAEGNYGRAVTDATVQLSLNPATYKAAAALTHEVAPVAKALGFVAKKIPFVGAVVTAGFVLYEVGADIYGREYGKAGAALAAGAAETAGNIVGFGVGDIARETVRETVVQTAGEQFAPDKSGLRQLGERAIDLGAKAVAPKTPKM